jgi:DNA-binding PadR family transcriptional regulator
MRHVATRHVEEHNKPLSEPVLLILISLAGKPRHGYSLIKDIEELSNGRVRLSTGTLYGALRRMLEDAWIERFQYEDTSRDKQTYRLTQAGRRQLQGELSRLEHLTHAAKSRMKPMEV